MNPLIKNPALQQPQFLQQPPLQIGQQPPLLAPRPHIPLIPGQEGTQPNLINPPIQQLMPIQQHQDLIQQQDPLKKEPAIQLLEPNNTLYLNHLNEKVPLDAKRNFRMRGQAFVVFDKVEEAAKALQALQGTLLFSKKMQLNYSKDKSDVILKREGNFQKREKVKPSIDEIVKKPQKKIKLNPEQPLQQKVQNPVIKQPVSRNVIIPNNILFVENLPENMTEQMLQQYFIPYAGFKEVRLIQSKRVAFAEFEDEYQSGLACNELAGKKIAPDYNLQISYAKK